MNIKPIETIHGGARMRSRLEARWAVFFDALEIPWEYEPEGYWVSDVPYLPDFYLPTLGVFAEVKPSGFFHREDDDSEKIKMEIIHSLWNAPTSGKERLIIISGNPKRDDYLIKNTEHVYTSPEGDDVYENYYCRFIGCNRCDGLAVVGSADPKTDTMRFGEDFAGQIGPHTCGDRFKWPSNEAALDGAYAAASMARFEHGETP
jgi:hypothetical protein